MNEHHVVTAERIPAARTAHRTKNKSGVKEKTITAQERECLIAIAAYYRAECRGFALGQEIEDWIKAEAEIDRQLGRD